MRSFVKQEPYSVSWEKVLYSIISIYETMKFMCEVGKDGKRKVFQGMLTSDTLHYFFSYVKHCETFEETVNTLRKWYNNVDIGSRILTEWQSMRFTEELSNSPDESRVPTIKSIITNLMSPGKQLDLRYYKDKFLTIRFMTAVDTPSIQFALRDQTPDQAQQITNRIAN